MHAETMTSTAGRGMRGQRAIVVLAAVLALLATFKLGSADIPVPIPPTFAFDPPLSVDSNGGASGTLSGSAGMSDLNLTHVPLTGSERGSQLAMLTLAFGGIPAALVAIVCAAARGTAPGSWDERWHTPFLLGVVFQAGHFAVLIVPMLIVVAVEPFNAPTRTAFLVASILASVVALPRWRRLPLAAGGRARLR